VFVHFFLERIQERLFPFALASGIRRRSRRGVVFPFGAAPSKRPRSGDETDDDEEEDQKHHFFAFVPTGGTTRKARRVVRAPVGAEKRPPHDATFLSLSLSFPSFEEVSLWGKSGGKKTDFLHLLKETSRL